MVFCCRRFAERSRTWTPSLASCCVTLKKMWRSVEVDHWLSEDLPEISNPAPNPWMNQVRKIATVQLLQCLFYFYFLVLGFRHLIYFFSSPTRCEKILEKPIFHPRTYISCYYLHYAVKIFDTSFYCSNSVQYKNGKQAC